MATPDNATGTSQAQSERSETATAAIMQPIKKPARRWRERLSLSLSAVRKGSFLASKSIAAKTALVKLPVITAVEIAPGIAKRSRAYWQAIADTAIITAMPAF